MNAAISWVCARRWRQALLLVLVSAAIFLPRLGATGLSMSEGHRAIPAWEMLEDARAGEAHWLVPRMFETAYLRKPPGMLWAIAGSTAVFGETEFAARFPSALSAMLLGLAVWWFATRWFGSPWGLAAGLAQVLLPVTWPSARSAEIESLHMLTTGVACLAITDALTRNPITLRFALSTHALLVLGIVGTVLTKGPAGAPFIVATFLMCWRSGERRGRFPPLQFALIVTAATVAALRLFAEWDTTIAQSAGRVVLQGVSDFMWEPSRLIAIFLLGLVVIATMLPASLALMFPFGPDCNAERQQELIRWGPLARHAETDIARCLAWSGVVSLLLLTVFGVGNPRYGLPLCALLTPLIAYVARGMGRRGLKGPAPAFVGKRPAIAQAMFLGRPWVWPVVLLIGAAVYVGVLEPDRRASSGRDAGIALAAALPDGAELWADEMVEARPEVLYYAVREAARQGRDVRVRWLKPSFLPAEQPGGLLLLLREDELVDEVSQYGGMPRFGSLEEIARGEVHKYTFVLVRAGLR
ncbi:MAG: hypothetical protein HND58_02130 [Planctomycetota bacterium]|nr:MAG: hypothetical protein HND58_02130 [Planctomycetota bacterium]